MRFSTSSIFFFVASLSVALASPIQGAPAYQNRGANAALVVPNPYVNRWITVLNRAGTFLQSDAPKDKKAMVQSGISAFVMDANYQALAADLGLDIPINYQQWPEATGEVVQHLNYFPLAAQQHLNTYINNLDKSLTSFSVSDTPEPYSM